MRTKFLPGISCEQRAIRSRHGKTTIFNRDVHPSGVGRSLKSEIPSDGCSIVSMENGEGQQIAVNAGVACNNATLKKGKSCGPSNPPVNGRDDKHSIHGRKAQKRIRRNSDYEKQKKNKNNKLCNQNMKNGI